MKKKYYTKLLFDSPADKEQYHNIRSWEIKTKNNLLLAKLTAPENKVRFYLFRHHACSGRFSILANSLEVYCTYDHCFAYTRNKAYFSYHPAEDRLYCKGGAKARGRMLRWLIMKRLKTRVGLDFLQEEDLLFVKQSVLLIHKLFSKEITSQNAAWRFYLKHCHNLCGNFDYKLLNELYVSTVNLACKFKEGNYVDLLFKLLRTSANIQKDIQYLCRRKTKLLVYRYFAGLINNTWLLQKKIVYSVSDQKREEIYDRQLEALLQFKIENGIISREPYIPFLPARVDLSKDEVQICLLNNPVAFLEEGAALRNCLFSCSSFRENTIAGDALYFSVSSTTGMHLRGTLELYLNDQQPMIHQFKSKQNQFDFLRPNNEKLSGSVEFLQTVKALFEGAEISSFIQSIRKHFKDKEQML